MKSKIIDTDKPEITDSEILKTKPSFNSLYSKFISLPAKTFFSKGFFYGGAGLAVIATTVVLLVINTNKGSDKQNTSQNAGDSLKSKSLVQEPIKSVAIPYKEYKFDAAKGVQITTCKGSQISVPENVFVYKDGTPVEGIVTLKCREFTNPVEIFQSGIPMNYDSANTHNIFESAGMIDLQAVKDGRPVYLANGKSLDVSLHSNNKEDRFNVYYLDTAKRNWVYQGRDVVGHDAKTPAKSDGMKTEHDIRNMDTVRTQDKKEIVVEKSNYYIVPSNKVISQIIDTVPVKREIIKPVLASKKVPVFKVDFNSKDFPELSVYQNLLFEVADDKVNFNSDLYSVNWDKISLNRTSHNDLYTVTLKKRDSVVSFIARPVFDKVPYEKALKVYAKAHEDISKTKPQIQTGQVSATNLTNTFTSGLADKSITTRAFKVYNMGIWNCDQPVPVSNFNVVANVNFKDANTGQDINCKSIYVATLNANILMQWSTNRLGYSKRYDNICFVVTYDENIGIVASGEFKNSILSGKSVFKAKIYSPLDGIRELNNWITTNV